MEKEIDKYSEFFAKAIMHKQNIPPLNEIKKIFINLSENELIYIIEKIIETEDNETFNLFIYYVILFRDIPNIQNFINSPELSVQHLERLIIYIHGYSIQNDIETERILDQILSFINNERFLDLILHSKHISRDMMLLIYILTRLDTKSLNKYFSSLEDNSIFIKNFLRIPDEIMHSVIERNYSLFQYILVMMSENTEYLAHSNDFQKKYKSDIDQLSTLNDVIRNYKEKIDIKEDKDLPFAKRNISRISFLVNQVRDSDFPEKTIEYFSSEHIFIDNEEKQIISNIYKDPMFKNSFKNYDHIFSVQDY